MTELFLKIFNMSITASVLVLLVLVLRLLLKKAPKWVNILLWGLVAIRLICPFGIESAFSLMPKTEWIVQNDLSEEDLYLNSVPHDGFTADSGLKYEIDEEIDYHYYPIQPRPPINSGEKSALILSCIWLAGIGGMFAYLICSYIRVYRRIRDAKQLWDNIYTSENIASPFVFGIIRPRICLPENMDAVSMSYVIAHEEAHIRRRDHWWKPLGFLLLTVYWFNPVLWLAYIFLCKDIELACDERVVKEYDAVQRADYSEALLECSVKQSVISACPLAFGEVSVKERIKSVLNYKKPAFWIVILAVVACGVTAMCFLTNPISRPVISIEAHDWYFERAYIRKHEKDITIEMYQPGLQPKTKNAEPVNAVLVPGDEPMWYDLITGDWDTNRFGNHFILEKADRKSAHYTVDLYRETGELYSEVTSTAVIEPMRNGDGYILTIYEKSLGADKEIIFTTEKQPGAEQGEKKLTLEEVLTLSEKQMALTWEDFAGYAYTDAGTWNFRCIYEIDDTFWLEITGGSMHGTPMQINLCTEAEYGDGAEYVDIRRTYADEDVVKKFIGKHKQMLFGLPKDWFYDTAWEKAQVTASEEGLDLDKDTKTLFYSENGEYVGVEFYEADKIRHVRITFLRDEHGNYSSEPTQKSPVEFTAVIKEFDTDDWENGEMQLNIVEFITRDDTERIAELELSEQDMISGYYIYDEDENTTTFQLPEDTEFIFFDWWDAYTDETDERYEILGERWISTRNAELFYEYWLPYADSPGYPFEFSLENGKLVIKEIPLM